MANPQPDQHTRIANELLDQIPFFKFNGSQLRIIMVVWRNTYGWNRKDHEFSLTFLHSNTGIPEDAIKKVVNALIQSRVLIVVREATKSTARRLSFNKNYEEWDIPKSGETMDDKPVNEGSNFTPPSQQDEGLIFTPHEGSEFTPQVTTLRGKNLPPEKESLLKKSFKENVALFETFYKTYPRRISKQAALKAWTKLCKEPDFDGEIVIQLTENFAKTHEALETSIKHIPHPSTYLNQKRYEDYIVVDPEGIAAVKKSKFDSNLDFLRDQIGGESNEQGSSSRSIGEGVGSIPE